MKRPLLGVLSVLLVSAATVPALKSEAAVVNATNFDNASTATRAHNPTTLNRSTIPTTNSQLKPFNLVYLAYQGYFKNQGIPSYSHLISAYKSGRVTSKDIVQSAVKANRLSSATLSDRGYLRAVEAKLRALSVD